MLWFTVVFLVALKIPMVWLVLVIWRAVRDVPDPGEDVADGVREDGHGPDSGSSWWHRRLRGNRPRKGPHGSPTRRPRTAFAQGRERSMQ